MRIGRRQDGRDRDGRLGVDLVRVVLAWTKVVLVVHMGNSGCIWELSLMCLVMDMQRQSWHRQLPVPSWHNWMDGSAIL